MIDKNTFIPFHHYTYTYIEKFARTLNVELKEYGEGTVGQRFLSMVDKGLEISFSFTSVYENENGVIFLCVFNNLPFSPHDYQVIRTENDDFLVHVHHQYDHYSRDMQFIGNLPYHLYQLAKFTLNNEEKITANSALDALNRYQGSTA